MTEVGSYLISQLQTAGFTTEPIDYTNVYENAWADRMTGTVMPPSPGVKQYRLQYEFEGDILSYSLEVDWRPITLWLVRKIPQWQVYHRSRSAVVSASPLRVQENRKRINNTLSWLDSLKKYALSDRLSSEFYRILIEKTKKYLKYDRDYIVKYIRDHKTSSFGGNYRWGQTISMSPSEWQSFYEQVSHIMELLLLNEGRYLNIVWKTGLRARSPEITRFGNKFEGEMDRSRIITFHPYMSSWNIFLTDKKRWYHEVLMEIEKILDVKPHIHYPYVEGGQIYLTASELFDSGKTFYARDGKSWDASVGVLLGKSFNPLMTYMRGLTILPSGTATTSILGTMANVAVSRNMSGDLIILGDDNNQWTDRDPGNPRVPWVELQPEDSRTKFVLGLTYANKDPSITGIKVMSDRADKNISIKLLDTNPVIKDGKHSIVETATWAGMFLGRFGKGKLLDRLRKQRLEQEDYVSPGQVIEDVIKKPANEDLLSWTEEFGVKRLAVA